MIGVSPSVRIKSTAAMQELHVRSDEEEGVFYDVFDRDVEAEFAGDNTDHDERA